MQGAGASKEDPQNGQQARAERLASLSIAVALTIALAGDSSSPLDGENEDLRRMKRPDASPVLQEGVGSGLSCEKPLHSPCVSNQALSLVGGGCSLSSAAA